MKETIFHATFKMEQNGQKTESSATHYSNEEKTLLDFVEWIKECQEKLRKSINQPNAEVMVTSINFIKNNY